MFDVVVPSYNPEDMANSNGCLVIWGGGDISPSLYGQHPCSRTGAKDEMSSQDFIEMQLAATAVKKGIPIIGICRGAQMMCAMAGGKLIQDVSGHGNNHQIETDTGKILTTTSVHHQMMFPWDIANYNLIAWTYPKRSKEYIEGTQVGDKEKDRGDVVVAFPDKVDPMYHEPEIIYLPQIKALCIQGHPEFIANLEHEFVQYCRALVTQYLISPFLK